MLDPTEDYSDRVTKQVESSVIYPYKIRDNIIDFEEELPSIYVQNIVCSILLDCTLNLTVVYSKLRYSEYNPKRFPGCVLKLLKPRVTAVAFSSGKIVILGTTTASKVHAAAKIVIGMFKLIGYDIKRYMLKFHNVIGICDLKFPVYLDLLYNKHCNFCRYEPDIFPALIYRLVKPKSVVLIFTNGKVIITGARSYNELARSLNNIYPVLCSFRKIPKCNPAKDKSKSKEIKQKRTTNATNAGIKQKRIVNDKNIDSEIKRKRIRVVPKKIKKTDTPEISSNKTSDNDIALQESSESKEAPIDSDRAPLESAECSSLKNGTPDNDATPDSDDFDVVLQASNDCNMVFQKVVK